MKPRWYDRDDSKPTALPEITLDELRSANIETIIDGPESFARSNELADASANVSNMLSGTLRNGFEAIVRAIYDAAWYLGEKQR